MKDAMHLHNYQQKLALMHMSPKVQSSFLPRSSVVTSPFTSVTKHLRTKMKLLALSILVPMTMTWKFMMRIFSPYRPFSETKTSCWRSC